MGADMTDDDVKALHERCLQFMTLQLPGQPQTMHMRSFTLVVDLNTALRTLATDLAAARAEGQNATRYAQEILNLRGELAAAKATAEAQCDFLQRDLDEAVRLVRRYRTETPLGNQPHMIAHKADAFLASIQSKEPSHE